GAGQVLGQLEGRDEQDPVRLDELQLFGVEVAAAGDDDAGGLDARRLQRATQRATACPVSAAREIAEVGMRVDPQEMEAGMPAHLRSEGADRRAVVTAEHREERFGRDVRQSLGHSHPTRLDVAARIEVADVAHAQRGHQVTVLRDRRHGSRQLSDRARGDRRALSIHGRAVVRNPGDDDVRVVLHDIARQAGPRAQAIEVQADTLLSGTFRMLSDPATNQSTKTPKTTGKPPGRPSRRGPALKASSKGPPMKTAMMPAPAVAMFEKPM